MESEEENSGSVDHLRVERGKNSRQPSLPLTLDETAEDGSRPSDNRQTVSPLATHLTGATSVIHSSLRHSWKGLLLEHHLMPPGERVETVADKHILWLQETFSSVQFSGRGGRFARLSKLPGEITLTPRGVIPTRHYFASSGIILCALEPDFINEVASTEEHLRQRQPFLQVNLVDSAAQRLIALLMEELRAGAPSGKLYTESLTHALAVRYLLLGEGPGKRAPDSPFSALPVPALKRVLDYIEEGLSSDVSLSSLAQEVGYSRGHFLKMFRQATGLTPHRFLLSRRVERARALLKRGASLVDVAGLCGFSSQAHFTQVFRQHLGITPGEYRRNVT
jgi:AraC family transcriptional regulator